MPTLYEYYNTGDDSAFNNRSDGLGNWGAQTFTPTISHKITSVKLKLYRVGLPGTLTVSIRATSGGAPVGADLVSGTTDGDTLTTDTAGEWREITLGAGYNLVAGAKYAILHRGFGAAGNIPYWREDSSSPTYASGSYFESDDLGVWTEQTTDDCMFEEWGDPLPSFTPKIFIV